MSDEWDSKTVIGFKRQVAKVAKKDSDINGTSPSLSTYSPSSDLVSSCKYNHLTALFTTSYIYFFTKARRSGAVVATDKKITAGGNKAHQGTSNPPRHPQVSHPLLGTDHQRIAKLDRENEVAPPAKIAPSVGRVGRTLTLITHVYSLFRPCKLLVLRSAFPRRMSLRKSTRSLL
jgi:hypothetical protein